MASRRPPAGLTEREWQVLQDMADGLTIRESADRLGLSAKGVEYHRAKLAEKVGESRAVLIMRWAIRKGLVKA
jgi:two-component system, NarL family, response regulator NreC